MTLIHSPVGAGLPRDSHPLDAPLSRGKPAPTTRPIPQQARACMTALALAVTLAGCAGLPDQRLANEALKRGDTALAEQNYRQLADLGYSEAQVGLADIQVETLSLIHI